MKVLFASIAPAIRGAMTAIAVGLLLFTSVSRAEPQDHSPSSRSNLCGPLCIQYVLQSYGFDESVVTISDQLQVRKHTDGVSLLAIREFLAARGVPSVATRIAGNKFEWPYPAILHVLSEEDRRGHFVVIHPNYKGELMVWDSGRHYPTEDELEHSTGFVLLTAPPGCASCLTSDLDKRREFILFLMSAVALPFSGFVLVRQLRWLAVKR